MARFPLNAFQFQICCSNFLPQKILTNIEE